MSDRGSRIVAGVAALAVATLVVLRALGVGDAATLEWEHLAVAACVVVVLGT